MSTPDPQLGETQMIETRLQSVERGVRLFAVTILLLSSAPNLALALSIRGYAGRFASAIILSSQSGITHFVFNNPGYILALAILWPVAGSFMTWRIQDPFRAVIASCVYLLLVLIQFTITWIAFAAPLRLLFNALPSV